MEKLISLRLNQNMLKEMDSLSKDNFFSNRSEFIKDSLRKSVDYYKTKKALLTAKSNYGKGRREGIKELSTNEFEKIRENAFIESAKSKKLL